MGGWLVVGGLVGRLVGWLVFFSKIFLIPRCWSDVFLLDYFVLEYEPNLVYKTMQATRAELF